MAVGGVKSISVRLGIFMRVRGRRAKNLISEQGVKWV